MQKAVVSGSTCNHTHTQTQAHNYISITVCVFFQLFFCVCFVCVYCYLIRFCLLYSVLFVYRFDAVCLRSSFMR